MNITEREQELLTFQAYLDRFLDFYYTDLDADMYDAVKADIAYQLSLEAMAQCDVVRNQQLSLIPTV